MDTRIAGQYLCCRMPFAIAVGESEVSLPDSRESTMSVHVQQ